MKNFQITEPDKSKSDGRLISIDAFRGATIAGMILVINPGSWKFIYSPLRHADWHGCTFADLIYPFFLFIVGVSITFSFSKSMDLGIQKKILYLKIIKRTIVLFVLGLFINTFPGFNILDIRIMGVLQRIAVCYFFVSIIFLNTKLHTQIVIAVLLLFIYWAIMEWIPVPGIGAGHYEKGNNFAAFFDRFFFKGHMGYYEKIGEPEGLISTLPAISSTLFGVLTGYLLKLKSQSSSKVIILYASGITAIFIGIIWGFWLPINKNLWTSSYTVLTTGYALFFFAAFYFLIDFKGYNRWFKIFTVVGMNAIAVYVLSIVLAKIMRLISFTTFDGMNYDIKSWLYDKIYLALFGSYNGSLVYAVTYCLLWIAIMWFFYQDRKSVV